MGVFAEKWDHWTHLNLTGTQSNVFHLVEQEAGVLIAEQLFQTGVHEWAAASLAIPPHLLPSNRSFNSESIIQKPIAF